MIDCNVKFKAIFLKKAFLLLVVVGVIISLLIFIFLDVDFIYKYMLSMLIIFSGIFVIFFLNRNEPERIKIKEDRIQFAFFNKVFFKRTPVSYSIKEINLESHDNDIMRLFKNEELFAVIRKEAIKTEDWESLKTNLHS
jgi:cell division protein FtsW (lipid II flippase)